jgi:hypothetical protein
VRCAVSCPTPPRSPVARWPWGPARRPAHQRTTSRGRGPGGARTLGRRPGLRQADEPGRNPGRALDAVPAAGPAARWQPQGRRGRRRPGRSRAAIAAPVGPFPDLGPGPRDGRAPPVHRGHGIRVYFCDPKSPWQRGSNENTNGLLRQYLPRRRDFRTLTQDDFDAIALELNERPRQTLGFKTPSQAFAEVMR